MWTYLLSVCLSSLEHQLHVVSSLFYNNPYCPGQGLANCNCSINICWKKSSKWRFSMARSHKAKVCQSLAYFLPDLFTLLNIVSWLYRQRLLWIINFRIELIPAPGIEHHHISPFLIVAFFPWWCLFAVAKTWISLPAVWFVFSLSITFVTNCLY